MRRREGLARRPKGKSIFATCVALEMGVISGAQATFLKFLPYGQRVFDKSLVNSKKKFSNSQILDKNKRLKRLRR